MWKSLSEETILWLGICIALAIKRFTHDRHNGKISSHNEKAELINKVTPLIELLELLVVASMSYWHVFKHFVHPPWFNILNAVAYNSAWKVKWPGENEYWSNLVCSAPDKCWHSGSLEGSIKSVFDFSANRISCKKPWMQYIIQIWE